MAPTRPLVSIIPSAFFDTGGPSEVVARARVEVVGERRSSGAARGV
jgi:hypothetical protein